jgi:hypothetical protein
MQCMAYSKQKNPSIQWIFEKCNETSERYNDNALLYQRILSYAIELNSEFHVNGVYESFTVWELTGWLIDNYHKYQNEMKDIPYKNMNRSKRIAAKYDGVESKLKSLQILDLIEEKGPIGASRGKEQTISLSFTHSGYLLARIIDSFNEEKRHASDIQIYKVLEYNYNDRSSSFELFALALIERYRSRDLFEELVVNTLRDRVNDSNWQIDSMLELIDSLSIPNFRNAKLFYTIWLQTLNEFEESQRNIVMQYVKLNIGSLIEKHLKYRRSYEEMRYILRDKPNMLAVEGTCNSCKLTCSSEMKLIDFFRIEKSPYSPSGMTCPWCGSSDTLSVSLPYD